MIKGLIYFGIPSNMACFCKLMAQNWHKICHKAVYFLRFQPGSVFCHLVPQTSGTRPEYWRSPAVPEECRPVSAIPHSQYKPGPVRQLVFQDWGLRFWLAEQINLQKKLATGNWAAKAGGTAKKYDWIWQGHFMRKNKKGKASLFLQAYLPPEESAMLFSFGIALLKFSEDDLMRAKQVVWQYNSSNTSQ